jgi:hypothetical protein
MKSIANKMCPFVALLLTSFTYFFEPGFKDVTQTHLPLPTLSDNTMDVEPADLDGDGDMDMVLAIEFKANILLINNGQGKFTNESATRLPQVAHDSEDVGVGDFDKDGDVDIIFVSEDDKVHEYYENDGKGYFKDKSPAFGFLSTCNAIDVADYDGDGDLDVVLGNDGQDFLLVNDGTGYFVDRTKEFMPVDYSITQDVQSGDIDGDKDLDLVFGNENGNRIYLNDGRGKFIDNTAKSLPPGNEETRKVDLADIDKDGHLDVFFSNVDFGRGKQRANRLLMNNGKGIFVDETSERYNVTNNMHTADVQFFDLDSDNDLDLVIANVFGGYLQVALNDGTGHFTEISDAVFPGRETSEAISLKVADMNKDGRPDIYVGMFRSSDRFFLGK